MAWLTLFVRLPAFLFYDVRFDLLIIGAGSGIGAAVCKILAREGAAIAAADLNKDGVAQTLSSLAVTDGEQC